MATSKFALLLSFCVLGMASIGQAETTLVIVTGEIPPAISKQSDQSFLTAVFQTVEQEMGVKFIFQFIPWKRCELALEKLDAWGAIPYIRTLEREKKFYFSDRLYRSTSKLFGYSADETKRTISYNELSELKPYKIGGIRGYWYEKMFHETGIALDLVNNEEQNIKKLQLGRIDFAPLEETAGCYIIKKLFPQEERGKFFTLKTPLRVNDAFLMTSKQYPNTKQLLARFNSSLNKIKDKGTFQRLIEKYDVKFIP